jgi:DNA-binding MarR family transcriptional regulator
MAKPRRSQLQKRILRWLVADYHRTHGGPSSSHQELVQVILGEKGNLSRSLHTLEEQGWIVIGRTPGGKAEYLHLTPEGLAKASEM